MRCNGVLWASFLINTKLDLFNFLGIVRPLLFPWNDVGFALILDMLLVILDKKASGSKLVLIECSKNCPGSRKVVPYTSSELEQPKSSLGTDLIPSNMRGSSSIQLWLLSLAFNDDFNCRWNLSIIPLHCGWNDVVFLVCIPRLFANSFHSRETNCLPRSDVIFIGTPNLDIHMSKALQHVDVIISFIGIASGQRVNRSIIVNIYCFSWDLGNGPKMSTWILSNLLVGVLNVFSGAFICICTLDFWQGTHVLAHSVQSLLILIQVKRAVINLRVALIPGCDMLCKKLKMVCWYLAGTIGLNWLSDVSHIILLCISMVSLCNSA